MSSENLEQKIGELSGSVDALIPLLERMEERQHEQGGNLERLKAKQETWEKAQETLTRNRREDDREVYRRLGELEKHLDPETGRRLGEVEGAVGTLQSTLKTFKKRQDGALSKVWDIFKIVLAAVLGAALALAVKGVLG